MTSERGELEKKLEIALKRVRELEEEKKGMTTENSFDVIVRRLLLLERTIRRTCDCVEFVVCSNCLCFYMSSCCFIGIIPFNFKGNIT